MNSVRLSVRPSPYISTTTYRITFIFNTVLPRVIGRKTSEILFLPSFLIFLLEHPHLDNAFEKLYSNKRSLPNRKYYHSNVLRSTGLNFSASSLLSNLNCNQCGYSKQPPPKKWPFTALVFHLGIKNKEEPPTTSGILLHTSLEWSILIIYWVLRFWTILIYP